jgi:DNA polymerase III alpha subunit
MKYVPLHAHSTYSYKDGYGLPKDHVERCVELGIPALAMTEHGNVSSWVALESACDSTLGAVKPIFGLEAYVGIPKVQSKCHMILLAMNQTGFANLNRIVTQSWKQFHYLPTVYWSDLVKWNEGLIALSGCAHSELACILLGGKRFGPERLESSNGDMERATRGVQRYAKVFGDRYYLEVQRFFDYDRTRSLNQSLAEISSDTGIPLVATSDVHYCYPEQRKMHQILWSARTGQDVEDPDFEFNLTMTYPDTDEQIIADLCETGIDVEKAIAAVENTSIIASRCEVVLPKAKPPKYVAGQDDWKVWVHATPNERA